MYRSAFQSTPVIADGRSVLGGDDLRRTKSFNPRPSSLTGDPPHLASTARAMSTFQSTPVIADGRSWLSGLMLAPSLVSIHARHR